MQQIKDFHDAQFIDRLELQDAIRNRLKKKTIILSAVFDMGRDIWIRCERKSRPMD